MKLIDSELYDLAVALADSAARSDIECICVRDVPIAGYKLSAVGSEDSADLARAVRYLELREASGDPLPYKIIRDGDKVRFE